jgi:hypothetical protein
VQCQGEKAKISVTRPHLNWLRNSPQMVPAPTGQTRKDWQFAAIFASSRCEPFQPLQFDNNSLILMPESYRYVARYLAYLVNTGTHHHPVSAIAPSLAAGNGLEFASGLRYADATTLRWAMSRQDLQRSRRHDCKHLLS